MASDDSEDFAPQPKKVTKAKAKASTSSKPKAAPKPKAKAASTKAAALKKAATKKTPIQTDSDDDVGGGEDVEMSFGGGGGDDSDDDAPPPPKKASGSKKTATETYTKVSPRESQHSRLGRRREAEGLVLVSVLLACTQAETRMHRLGMKENGTMMNLRSFRDRNLYRQSNLCVGLRSCSHRRAA